MSNEEAYWLLMSFLLGSYRASRWVSNKTVLPLLILRLFTRLILSLCENSYVSLTLAPSVHPPDCSPIIDGCAPILTTLITGHFTPGFYVLRQTCVDTIISAIIHPNHCNSGPHDKPSFLVQHSAQDVFL